MVLVLMIFASCSDDNNIDLSNRKFVRIDQSSISMSIGEKMKVTATVDTIKGDAYKLSWSILDPNIAKVDNSDNNEGIITAVAAGKTVVKVESTDGKLMYFADLTVAAGAPAIKILTIGSGSGNDATVSYLQNLVKAAGKSLVIGNLYLDGASLEDHSKNISQNQAIYKYNRIAIDGSENLLNDKQLKSVVKGENWDYISIEENMPLSGKPEGYQAYLSGILEHLKKYATNPDVKYILHQPWAYAKNATDAGFINYNRNQESMFRAIVDAVSAAASSVNMDIVVPSGTAIQNGRTSYIGEDMLKDERSLNPNIGRFITACTWFEALFGGDITSNEYMPESLSKFDTKLAKEAAHQAVNNPKEITVLEDYLEKVNDFVLEVPIYIDFGDIFSPAPFNNFRHPNDQVLGNLKDEKGNASSFDIAVKDPFTGTLARGLENGLGFPKSASEDMFFSDGLFLPLSSFKLSNLNKDLKYSFLLYGSINDAGTETQYTISGKNEESALLVTDYNFDRSVLIRDIIPADDATIVIKLQPGPHNTQWARFMGINALIIMPEGYQLPQ